MVRAVHFVIVGLLALFAIGMLIKASREAPALITALRQAPPDLHQGEAQAFLIDISFLAWIPTLLCAWGIWKWRRWAQVLTIVVCGFAILLQIEGAVFWGRPFLAHRNFIIAIVEMALVVWLLLPSVRSRFHA
jgi:hypothetical protein